MGAANVIPGVSGGTIALITGIYERLINAIKSADLNAIKLILKGDVKGFWERIDGSFLTAVFAGVGVSIFSLALLLKFLLANYELYTMAFFFGLILISVVSVGRTVENWHVGSIVSLIIGTAIAAGIALLAHAEPNDAFWYVFICGIVAVCSMILPGLSGSFILLIMGNYALVLTAISGVEFNILIPLLLGCVVGLVAFSQLLSWVLANYKDQTISMMTGFVLGSLLTIWPWKNTVMKQLAEVDKEVVDHYEWFFPDFGLTETYIGIALIIAGVLVIYAIEKLAANESAA